MIERLEEVDDIETRTEIDDALEESEDFDRMVKLFEELGCSVEYADQRYLNGEVSDLHKWYRTTKGDIMVKLNCRVPAHPDLDPSLELTVKPKD